MTVELAIENLAGHCAAVLAAHGLPGNRTSVLSLTPHALDIPFPNAITLGGRDRAAEQFDEIREFVARRLSRASTGVVDAYSCLDLSPLDFEVLFSDPWLVREPGPMEMVTPDGLSISEAASSEDLKDFEAAAAAGFEASNNVGMYPDVLLRDPRYRFFLGWSGSEIASGVVSFTTEQAVGIYSLFTLPHARRQGYGDAIVRAALTESPPLPAVTNASNMSVKLFGRLGFDQVGTRTIWVRPGDGSNR